MLRIVVQSYLRRLQASKACLVIVHRVWRPCQMTRDEYLIRSGLPHKRSIMEKKMIERGETEAILCDACGADLIETFRREIEPLPCTRSQVICGFPCGRRNEAHVEGVMPCPHMVPVGKIG